MGLPANSYKQLISFYGFTDPETERLVNGRAREHFLNHPLAFARKFVLNAIEYYAPVIYFLYPPDGTYPSTLSLKENVLAAGGRLALGLTIFNLTMVFLAVAGAKVLYRTAESRFVPFSIIVAWLAFAVPYFPFLTFYLGRSYYTLGTFPMISLLAAVFLVHKFTKIRGNELPNSVAQAA